MGAPRRSVGEYPDWCVDAAQWISCMTCDALPGEPCRPSDPRNMQSGTHGQRLKDAYRDEAGSPEVKQRAGRREAERTIQSRHEDRGAPEEATHHDHARGGARAKRASAARSG